MMLESPTLSPARDRRVRRSRAALMSAAVALVSERGTADVPVSDIAEAADVSRRLVYQQFSDRDTLLLEAALDLARRELLLGVTEGDGHARALEDLAAFLTGGWGNFVHTWVIEGQEPLNPEEFAGRLLRAASALLDQKGDRR